MIFKLESKTKTSNYFYKKNNFKHIQEQIQRQFKFKMK